MSHFNIPDGMGIPLVDLATDLLPEPTMDALDARYATAPSEAQSEVFTQPTPSATWTITHSLPFTPSVSIVDSAGTLIHTEILYDSPTQIRSISSAAFSGVAYLS